MGLLLGIVIAALTSHGKGSTSTTVASGSSAPATSATSAPPPAKHHAVRISYTPCDTNISVGPHTTCGFADNVFRAFASTISSEGSERSGDTVSATSPATGKSYAMSCRTNDGTTRCIGGNDARVRFPVHAAQVYNQPSTPRTAPPSSSETPTPAPEESEPESQPGEPEGASPESPECTNGSYTNSSGNTVCKPEESPNGPPAGATAECADGTYSFSEHRSGTCSDHGGVANWLE